MALDPSHADHHRDLAEVLIFAGRLEEALESIETAIRLNPHYPVTYPFTLGFAHAGIGFKDGSPEHYEKAIAALEEAIALNPNFTGSHLVLAFIYSETGQEQEARTQVAHALEINPQLTLAAMKESVLFKEPAVMEAFLAALEDAGLN